MMRRIAMTVATAAVAVGTIAMAPAGAAAPAEAAGQAAAPKGWKHCPKGAVCLYTKPHGQGKVYKIWANTNRNYKHISSMWNNGDTSHPRDHAKIKRFSNDWTCLAPGSWRSGLDYTVDAVRWRSGC
ncbi:peptidase inhibitor family I36 protein [Streptomyces violens]|uniref:peptidase inhibitor family I36 protein n=1 Tax=Streptomyces violens TaxID=66377 RepID=UPI0004C1AB9D|nr:peptidase inhibitor family I36 protein [Streptomyces violens]